jgi:hypothetical protein
MRLGPRSRPTSSAGQRGRRLDARALRLAGTLVVATAERVTASAAEQGFQFREHISHAWRPRSAVPGGCGPSRTTSGVLPSRSWHSRCRFDGQASV